MLRLVQEMKLTQKLDVRMIQSLKLLPLTTMQLEQRINEELELNPMLQVEETQEKEPVSVETQKTTDESGQVRTSSVENEEKGDFTEAEWLKYMEQSFDYSYGSRKEYDPNIEDFEPVQTYTETLYNHLINQLGMTVRNEIDREIGEFIIGSINENGFLELPDEVIANDLNVQIEDVRRLISIIQQFDPVGVGARDLRESLLIQLKDREYEDSHAWNIVDTHFDDFKKRRFKDIIRNLSISEEELKEAMTIISSLTPKPGAVLIGSSNPSIIPDIIVERVDGEYVVMLNDHYTPRLSISPSYHKLLDKNAGTSQETRKYLVDKLNGARWFINSIEQRRTTILRVANAIVESQKGFLEHGISYLKPMTLQKIAEIIGVAISTVQRVTTGKYIQTPQGVYELKYFFTQRISSSDGSEDLSAKSVKEKLRLLIEEENHKKPLSDQKITDILNEQSISISRRAIAKYRDELQIPPARLRKQL
ncbi:RNA polymerase factor sigma-54 [Candidatus Latescibacterota bacterium]